MSDLVGGGGGQDRGGEGGLLVGEEVAELEQQQLVLQTGVRLQVMRLGLDCSSTYITFAS